MTPIMFIIYTPLLIFLWYVGIKGAKVMVYAMKTGKVPKENEDDSWSDFGNAFLIFFGGLFSLPIAVYLTFNMIAWACILLFKN